MNSITQDQHNTHRILVVEDDPAILSNTARMLRLEGFEVNTARSGVEALQRVKQSPPDLILCDIRMPEMTGDELLDALQSDVDTASIPFIFASASAEPAGRMERLAKGALGYLVKPYDFKDLLAAIRRLLHHDAAGQ